METSSVSIKEVANSCLEKTTDVILDPVLPPTEQ